MLDILHVHYDTTHNNDFVYIDESCNHDWWLLLLVHTPVFFEINGEHIISEKCAILYPPHSILHYGAESYSSNYVNDWVRFYTDETYITKGLVSTLKPFYINEFNYLHTLIKLLFSECFYNNDNKSSSIDYIFRLLFNKLQDSYMNQKGSTNLEDIYSLRLDIKNNPGYEWNITKLAKRMHISNGYFQKLYSKTFGLSCMEDVINMRISLAKHLLSSDNIPIKIVARNCGYNNIEHFSRQFKKQTKLSPGMYRSQHSNF